MKELDEERERARVRFRERKQVFWHDQGMLTGIALMAVGFVIYGALMQLMWIIPIALVSALVLTLGLGPIVMTRRSFMLTALRRLLGIEKAEMKLQAVAKYLKVKFKHIPEQYECEKLPEQTQ